MIPPTFDYHAPRSVGEALTLLGTLGSDAKLLAGGHSLLPMMKLRFAQPAHLIDLNRIAELRGIREEGATICIGAMTVENELIASALLQAKVPLLAEAARQIADPQVRNRGTIGGSVANNDPAADCPAAVLGLNAKVITNRREIAADGFFQGMFATALEAGELVVRIAFPLPEKAAYAKFPHPASGYAMAGVFIAQTASGVRVAVTGAGAGVFRWTDAEQALAKKMDAAVLEKLALATDDLNEDIHGSREYRAQLVKVMAARAVAALTGKN